MSALGRLRAGRLRPRRPAGSRAHGVTGPRRLTARRLRRPRLRTILALVLVVLLLGGGWLWLRGSSLVAVDHVTVTGLRGPQSAAIRTALTGAARSMTTLEVNQAALRAAVAPFPIVKSLQVSAGFPHALRIHVLEQGAVGAVDAGGRRTAVAADGTLLPSVSAAGLPTIPVPALPAGARVTGAGAQGAVAVLAAAPAWLRARVSQVTTTTDYGLVADLGRGPQLRFGAPAELAAKWKAAVDVLAQAGAQGASYIDVSVPARPVAGGVASGVTGDSSGLASSGVGTTGTTAGAGATGASGTGTPVTGTPATGTPATGAAATGTPATATPATTPPTPGTAGTPAAGG